MLTVEYSPRGYEGHNCSQRLMVLNGEQHFPAMRPGVMVLNGEQHFQAMRPSVSRRGGQSPRYRETHGTGGRTSGILGMLGPW